MVSNKGVLYRTLETIGENLLVVSLGVYVLVGIGLLGGVVSHPQQMYSATQQAQVKKAGIEVGLELKVGDYNGNQILDKFYEIDGKIPVEIDGKPVVEYFKQ